LEPSCGAFRGTERMNDVVTRVGTKLCIGHSYLGMPTSAVRQHLPFMRQGTANNKSAVLCIATIWHGRGVKDARPLAESRSDELRMK